MPRSGTRPTSDRVRESLFNVLDARLDLDDVVVLDLYAGSGALGLEAISRGAARAVFVEQDHRAAETVARNVTALGVGARAELRRAPVATVLAGGTDRPAGLVFADPPYDVPVAEVEQMLDALAHHRWLSAGAVAVIERRASGPAVRWPPGWEPWPMRRYGDTRLEMAEFGGSPRRPTAATVPV